MKRIFILIPLLGLAVGTASAQIKIGVKEGLNIATIDYTTKAETKVSPISSMYIGGFIHYGFTDHFGAQVELMYSGQGAKIDFYQVIKTKNKLNYLSLPILIKYHSSSGFTAEIGLGLDFLLSAKQSFDEIDLGNFQNSPIQLSDYNLKDDLTGLDTKILLGVGYELPSGLSFSFRYAGGLNNISKPVDPSDPDYDPNLPDEESYNVVFQLGVGFPLYGN